MTSLSDVQQTFSSWDSCMSKDYCKWPAIVGIIVGSIVVLSLIFCIARCLCFGAECCACCFSCCSCCCPSRRGGRRGRGYQSYQQPPPPPPPAASYGYPQYQSPPAPFYGQQSPYRGQQTATFDVSKPQATARFNEDALPVMPSWDTAPTRRVEEEPVEMERLDDTQTQTQQQQQQHLLAGHAQGQQYQSGYANDRQEQYNGQSYVQSPQSPQSQYSSQDYVQGGHHNQYSRQDHAYGTAASPYHDYSNHQQYEPPMSPVSTIYAPSTTMPPSYHTRAPSIVSPIQSSPPTSFPARRPVQGSWRDI